MKICNILASFIFAILSFEARAESYTFPLGSPFSAATLDTTKGKETVKISVGSKAGEETIYESKLTRRGNGPIFMGKSGFIFTFKELSKSIDVDKGLKHGFTAKYRLIIAGSGKTLKTIQEEVGKKEGNSVSLLGWKDEE